MAKVDYDGFAGIHRISEAEATIDQRAAVILTFHAALEREVDVVLAALMPRAHKIRHFGYGHKIDVLAAAWKAEPEEGEKLHKVLFRFNELRNAVAHGDRSDLVEAALKRLVDAYLQIAPDADYCVEIAEVAQGICAFMADGPTIREFSALADGLDRLVNVTMPAALGVKPSNEDTA